MSLFGNLLGRKGETPEDAARRQQFDEDWVRAIQRFGIVTGLGAISLELKHPKTGKVMAPHEGLGQTFQEWKSVEAAYDRRVLLFDQLFNTVGRSMKHWHIANYLTATRYPNKALALLEQAEASERDAPGFHAASARALLTLGRSGEALVHAKQAAEAEPNNARVRTLYADTLHLSGRCEEAHTIYGGLQAAAAPAADDADPIASLFAAQFSQETGGVPSPVLALELAESLSDPAQAEEFWGLAETEFYDSAYFRMHHAYHLSQSENVQRGFAKLLALVREMPWLREPTLNLMEHFRALDPTGQQLMPEFQVKLLQTIQKNGWTTEGMSRMKSSTEA